MSGERAGFVMAGIERISDLERRYVEDVLAASFSSSSGAQFMRRFEVAFADRFNSAYAISMVNGTATLHATLEALGVGPGDEVVVPPLTMSSTSLAVLQCGGTPIFADVDRTTFQVDPGEIERCFSDRTRAVMTVALYGGSPRLAAIRALCESRGVALIEDNAECFLGRSGGQLVGTFGDAASFSFQSSKHLTSGEGGVVITNNGHLADRIRRISSLGYAGVSSNAPKISKSVIQSPDYFRHVELGWNYRMPELCAAVALAQTERIDELVGRRVAAGEIIKQAVDGCEWLRVQGTYDEDIHAYWTLVVEVDTSKVGWKDFYAELKRCEADLPYGAWQLSYREPVFREMALLGREVFLPVDYGEYLRSDPCPVASALQPALMQFPTNYWSAEAAHEQGERISKAISKMARS